MALYMCQVLHVVDFLGSRRMETAPTSIEVLLVQLKRAIRRAIWFTWFSEPDECIQHLAVQGGHPSDYEPGATLLNFSDRAQTIERTPYSVFKWSRMSELRHLWWFKIEQKPFLLIYTKIVQRTRCKGLTTWTYDMVSHNNWGHLATCYITLECDS